MKYHRRPCVFVNTTAYSGTRFSGEAATRRDSFASNAREGSVGFPLFSVVYVCVFLVCGRESRQESRVIERSVR